MLFLAIIDLALQAVAINTLQVGPPPAGSQPVHDDGSMPCPPMCGTAATQGLATDFPCWECDVKIRTIPANIGQPAAADALNSCIHLKFGIN
jgi:hypothetical protein